MAKPSRLNLVQLGVLTDDEIISHLKNGHDEAFAVIFERYHRLVFTIGLKVLRDLGEAEDLMQTVFLEIYRSAAKFDPARGTLKVWILQFAYHRSINRREYLTVRKFYEQDQIAIALERPEAASGYGSLTMQEVQSLLRQGLDKLTSRQREALRLCYFEGLTMPEVAKRTGQTVDSVVHHYYRGLDHLRKVILNGDQQRTVAGEGRAARSVPRGRIVDAEA